MVTLDDDGKDGDNGSNGGLKSLEDPGRGRKKLKSLWMGKMVTLVKMVVTMVKMVVTMFKMVTMEKIGKIEDHFKD